MQINYADEVIDFLSILEIDTNKILVKDDTEFAEWLYEKQNQIAAYLMGKYRTKDFEDTEESFSDIVVEIKNKLLESKE